MIFLNKILEVDPLNLEARLRKGELYHYHLGDYTRAVEQSNKIIRFAPKAPRPSMTRPEPPWPRSWKC